MKEIKKHRKIIKEITCLILDLNCLKQKINEKRRKNLS